MKNPHLKNLNKIEFAVTYACTGRCRHCSEGTHNVNGERIDPFVAADAVRKIASEYDIKTVMTFGGEPMLHANAVFTVMQAARDVHIPTRQVITNGYFSKDIRYICEITKRLADCGVNDLLLSVDAFHQEFIPIEPVKAFAAAVVEYGIPTRLQPAWLVSPDDKNPYNLQTRHILETFRDMGIAENEGNIIFPAGSALQYLAEYFTGTPPKNPYIEDPCDVRCISFSPNGDVLGGNIYRSDIADIMKNYDPRH